MTTLAPWRLPDLMDWFEEGFPFSTGARSHHAHTIRVEDRLTDHDYELRAELPGMDPEKDMEITVNAGVLTIHAERNEKKEANGRSEFRYGRFDRSVLLPRNVDADHIKAAYDNGVLTVTVPLTEVAPPGKKVLIGKGTAEIDAAAAR
jgi:HSP20 family protein